MPKIARKEMGKCPRFRFAGTEGRSTQATSKFISDLGRLTSENKNGSIIVDNLARNAESGNMSKRIRWEPETEEGITHLVNDVAMAIQTARWEMVAWVADHRK
jgi:hypothetical protein